MTKKTYKEFFKLEENILDDKKEMLKVIQANLDLLNSYDIEDLYKNVILLKLAKDTANHWELRGYRFVSSVFGSTDVKITDPYNVILKNILSIISTKSQGKSPLDISIKKRYIYAIRYIWNSGEKNVFTIADKSMGLSAFVGMLYTAILGKLPSSDQVTELVDKYFKGPGNGVFLYTYKDSGKIIIPELKNVELNLFKNKKIVIKHITNEALDQFTNYVNLINTRD